LNNSNNYNLRLFFAIELKPEFREALAQLINTLRKESWGHRVRWVRPENLHITLRFLGSSQSDQLDELIKKIEQAVKNIKSFALQIENVRLFPSPTAPRVIAANICPTSELFELAYALEEVAVASGFAPETKPYLPHLTLGRIVNRFVPSLKENITLGMKAMAAEEIVLFNSEKQSFNHVYTPLQRISLLRETIASDE